MEDEARALRIQVSTLEEVNRQLREPWIGVPFLPPEWRLTPNESRILMVMYRKRGIHISRDSLVVAVYGEHHIPKNHIISVMISRLNRVMRDAGSVVKIVSNKSADVRYWLDTASVHELDYLLDFSTQPIPYRSQR